MVFGVVLLILLAVQSRSMGTSGELFSVYSGKVASLDLATLLEEDMDNIGEGIDIDSTLFISPVQDSLLTREFVFNQIMEDSSTGATLSKQHRYRLLDAPSVIMDTSSVQTYKLVREERERPGTTGAFSAWKHLWESDQLLTYFNVSMQDHNFAPTSFPDSAKYVRIAFTSVPPYQKYDQYLRAMNWNTVTNVRPF